MPKKPTQRQMVFQHLRHKGPISPAEAVRLYNIWRLAAVIHDLRKMGWEIETETKTGSNQYGKFSYAEYTLKG